MDELITKVEQWAKDKGLDQADSSKQMLKTIEEIGEVAASLARKDEHGLRDGIGDVVVTLIILAMQNDMDLSQYLGHILVETVKPFFLLLILQIPVGLDSESSYGFDFGYKILQCS